MNDDTDPAERLGTVIAERYRLDALIGEGGMGTVYSAEHVLMKKRVAVKILRRELTDIPDVVARFEREAMAAANIDHENVAGATDFGRLPDGSVFLVLEYVQGRTLRDDLAYGRFEPPRALHVARQIANALAAAHAIDVVHRDLKPENVVLVAKGADRDFVKILDFGIAKVPIGDAGDTAPVSGKPITKVGYVVGTPEYMAPEQALGERVDARADLYSLGVMLYELLVGDRPYGDAGGTDVLGRQLSGPPVPPAERVPGAIPPALDRLVMRLLATKKTDRFGDAESVVVAIDGVLHAGFREQLPTMRLGSPSEPPRAAEAFGAASAAALPPPASYSAPGFAAPDDEPLEVPVTRGALDRALEVLRASYRDLEARRRTLPHPLRRVPSAALLGGVAAAVLLVVVVVGAIIRKAPEADAAAASASVAPSAPPPVVAPVAPSATPGRLSAAEVDAARAGGVEALAALAEKHRNDPGVHAALSSAHREAKSWGKALEAAERAVSIDPAAAETRDVRTTLYTTAQAKATSDAAFDLMENRLGSPGAEILYDLATQEGVARPIRRRAEAFLGTKQFQRISSPALLVLVELRTARTCEQRKALLLRAKNVGDWRVLDYVEKLEQPAGCGRKGDEDCHPCLRSDDRLAEALKALRARVEK